VARRAVALVGISKSGQAIVIPCALVIGELEFSNWKALYITAAYR
jgi:hypothetical protein